MTSNAPRHQLLDDPIIGVEDARGTRAHVPLPELLARLSRGELADGTALQAHQQFAWHAFLVQLAALCAARDERASLEQYSATEWRELLCAAARADGAGEEAFALVVPDLSKAAFLQAPLPSGSLADLRNVHARPSEELDVLITSKNHDVKIDRIVSPRPEHWVFALVMLQTTQGFLGAGNYGIARMNGGFASRPGVGFSPSMEGGKRFVRDVNRLLGGREMLLEAVSAKARRGTPLGLVWCRPWDGATSLSLDDLDPYFIEICRRVRLVTSSDGHIVAHRGSSKAARIDAKLAAGKTGDAWTPIGKKNATSLTVPEAGFSYERVSDLLGPEWAMGIAGELTRSDGAQPFWVGQVLVRGQGKTGGYHERWIPIPPAVQPYLLSSERRTELAHTARAWVEAAKDARLRVLKPAVIALVQGGTDKPNYEDDRVGPVLRRFDAEIDAAFFAQLFEHVEQDGERSIAHWQRWLYARARASLESAIDALPTSAARRERAIARADSALFFGARKYLPQAIAKQEQDAATPREEHHREP